jgi:thiol-disulfide isomerase/thioredoxin
MKSGKILLFALVVILVGVGIWYTVSPQDPPMGDMVDMTDDDVRQDETSTVLSDMDEESPMGEAGSQNGSYSDYSPDQISLAESGKVVLFFHASWCPTCRAADKSIASNIATIPDGVHILKVDYDSATDLRREYGVTTQHTFVQIDANGNFVTKFSGLRKVDDIVAQLR